MRSSTKGITSVVNTLANTWIPPNYFQIKITRKIGRSIAAQYRHPSDVEEIGDTGIDTLSRKMLVSGEGEARRICAEEEEEEGGRREGEEEEAGDEDPRRDEEGLEGKWVAILATTKQW